MVSVLIVVFFLKSFCLISLTFWIYYLEDLSIFIKRLREGDSFAQAKFIKLTTYWYVKVVYICFSNY